MALRRDGAIGVVLNRQLELLPDVLEISEVDLSPYASSAVSWEDPAGLSGTVVARSGLSDDEGWSLRDDLGVTRVEDRRQLLGESAELMLFLGYAGWGRSARRGDCRGGWLFTDIETWLLFDTEPQQPRPRAVSGCPGTPW